LDGCLNTTSPIAPSILSTRDWSPIEEMDLILHWSISLENLSSVVSFDFPVVMLYTSRLSRDSPRVGIFF